VGPHNHPPELPLRQAGFEVPPNGNSAARPLFVGPARRGLSAFTVLAIVLAATPVISQYRQQRPAAKADPGLVGLPIFSSDGKEIGRVLATGIDDDDQAVLVAEIARSLGIGADAVAIPTDMFVRKGNRIELTITDAEVRDRLARAKHER
jgi:PRC-barrel domain